MKCKPEPAMIDLEPRTGGTALLIVLLSIGGLTLLLSGCEISKPELPTFDTSLSIPLGIERLDILDLVEDEEFLVVGNDSSLGFFIEGTPDTVDFDYDLTVDIDGQSFQQGLGNFNLPPPAPMGFAFELGNLWPPAAGLINQPAMVPGFPFEVSGPGQTVPDIDSATLASGLVSITLTNGLPVPISADYGPQQVVVHLLDAATGLAFASITFDAIAPGDQSTRTADLAGVLLSGEVAAAITGGSPGSDGAVVNVSGTDSIGITATFENLVVTEATAVVGPQTLLTDFDTDLPDDYQITQAIVSQGNFLLSLSNDLPIAGTTQVTWPNLMNLEGDALTEVFNLEPGQSLSRTIVFSGHILQAENDPLTTLAAEVIITSAGSEGLTVTMSSSDGLTADLSSGALTFSSVTGSIPAYGLQVEPLAEEINLPEELDGMELTAATMVVHLTNSAALPGELDLTLSGTSSTGQVRTLQVTQAIAPAIERAPQTTNIHLDQDNSTIVDFLNNRPETIVLSGSVQVGGEGGSGTIHSDDFAVVAWQISAPLEVIVAGSVITTDPKTLDLDQHTRDLIVEHALGAVIITEIANHFPLGIELRVLAGTDPATLSTAPLMAIGPLVVEAAAVDPLSHTAISAVISRPEITLNEDQAKIFALPGLITALEVVLPSTNGIPVRMMASDFLEVQGLVQVDVMITDQW